MPEEAGSADQEQELVLRGGAEARDREGDARRAHPDAEERGSDAADGGITPQRFLGIGQ